MADDPAPEDDPEPIGPDDIDEAAAFWGRHAPAKFRTLLDAEESRPDGDGTGD